MKISILILFFLLFSCKSKIVESEGNVPISNVETLGEGNSNKENNRNPDLQTEIPPCISERIDEIKKGKVLNPPTIVTQYSLNGKRYFLIPSGCCDQYDYIIDENCKILCSKGVGIDGKFKNTCENDLNLATSKVIWRDLR